MPLIYKPYQATLANKEGQKLFYPRLVKIGRTVNTQKMAELIAEKASLTAGTVRLEGLGTFTMVAKACGKGVEQESKVSSSQIVSLRCQFTPEYTRSAGNTTRALTAGVEFVHVKDVAAGLIADGDTENPGGDDKPGGGNTPGGGGVTPDPSV